MEQIGWPGGTPVFGVDRLLDGPDSLTPTRKPHRASEPGSYSADVSDAARAGQRPSRNPGWRLPWRRVRSRRANRKPCRPYKG